MSCEKFEQQIALYIEDDLSLGEVKLIEEHLSHCLSCEILVSELTESQVLVKRFHQTAINETMLESLHFSVMAEIRQQTTPTSLWQLFFNFYRWRYAFAMLVMAMATITTTYYFWQRTELPTTISNGQANIIATVESAKDIVPELTHSTHNPEPLPIRKKVVRYKVKNVIKLPVVKQLPINAVANVAIMPLENLVSAQPETTPASTAKEESKIKMELRTNDPNIRIIWFFNAGERSTS